MMYARTIGIGITFSLIVCALSILILYKSLGPCPKGTLACDLGQVCVPQRQICDNRIDCKDGTDENLIECGLLYGSRIMTNNIIHNIFENKKQSMIGMKLDEQSSTSNAKNLNPPLNLNKSWRNIQNIGNGKYSSHNIIDKNIFESNCEISLYPSKCSCHRRTLLYCGPRAKLLEIPSVGEEITNLIIFRNNLTLKKDTFSSYNNLRKLKLKCTNIMQLPKELFVNLPELEQLDIRFNNISRIPEGLFHNLPSLRWLFLASNNLSKVNITDLGRKLTKLEWLVLSDNRLTLNGEHFPSMPNLLELYLDYNQISYIDDKIFSQLGHLHLLNLNGNYIKHVHPKAFWGLQNIRDIRLMYNPLKQLSGGVFTTTTHLEALSLAYTPLRLSHHFLWPLNISYLNVTGIHYNQIDFDAINLLRNLKYIIYDRFYYCSMTPNVRICKPNTDGISSLTDLLSKPILRYTTRIMSFVTISGNLLVLWGRFKFPDENRNVSIVIKNLAMADILMGVYLLIIAILDYRYRDVYHKVAMDWITSWYCVIMGAIAVSSSEISILILSLMSVERFILIANPLHSPYYYCFSKRLIITSLILIWIIGVALAVIPVILWYSSTKFYGTYSGICYPLHIQEPYPLGWQYSAFMFLGLNSYLVIMITILYTILLISIYRTRKATPLSMSECQFTMRFFFIVLTDILCWTPIIIMKIQVFFNYSISDDVYGWLVVFVLPLNSAINPLLYTFTTPKYRQHVLPEEWRRLVARYKLNNFLSTKILSTRTVTNINISITERCSVV